ncbi:MAG: hypothetical protein HY735_34600 [Verrucomicrobia bacterium]|nr:hypothetical protein [Verrucomicrobiota bacterium]
MAVFVYLLCTLTSIGVASLLIRGYRRSRAALLLWSSACFVGLAVANILLFLDLVVVLQVDLSVWRNGVTLLGLLLLLYGLIWNSE